MNSSDFSHATRDVLMAIFNSGLRAKPDAGDLVGWQELADWIAEDDGQLDSETRTAWDKAAEEISMTLP